MGTIKSKIPNALTILRIACIPVIIFLLYQENNVYAKGLAIIFFSVSSATDFLDGFLARKFNACSDLGRLLDPLADKLLVITTLVLLASLGYVEKINIVAVAYIIQREIFISGLRDFFGQKQIVIHSSSLGKAKTASQMVSITLLLIFDQVNYPRIHLVGVILLWVAMLLGLVSAGEYTIRGFKKLKK